MRAWADFLRHEDQETGGQFLRTTGFHFADWLALDNPDKQSCFGGTDPYFIASAYDYRPIRMTAQAARALEREKEAEEYGAWAEKIREAFRARYLLPGGDNVCRTQTSYVLALAFDLTPEEDRADTLRLLEEKLDESNMHLTTGFAGTPCLCPLLSEHGATMDQVLKTTVHLADLADFAEFNEAYQEFFSAPYPVRTTVGSQLANILVEIDVVARVES